MNPDNVRIAIIGLGYVGLPLAVEFGKHFPTFGFDLKQARIDELRAGQDSTLETTADDLKAARHLGYTTTPDDLAGCNVYIVTVPTPIDRYKRPDLTPLEKASETVGRLLKPGDPVIYESTVYPGCTEEVCVPILERESGLAYARGDLPLPLGQIRRERFWGAKATRRVPGRTARKHCVRVSAPFGPRRSRIKAASLTKAWSASTQTARSAGSPPSKCLLMFTPLA